MTNAAFLQNAMACEEQEGRTQYLNLPEVDAASSPCGQEQVAMRSGWSSLSPS